MSHKPESLDFFISYASENRVWAEWISLQLERAGYVTKYQAADFRPGQDFVHEMQQGVSTADRTIAVLSPAYLRSQFGEAEWRTAFAQDPTGEKRLLIPVRVQPCDPPGLLATRVYVDLGDAVEAVARKKLLAAVDQDRPRPSVAPFPGPVGAEVSGRTRFPGAGPAVVNLPARNPVFTGRTEVIRGVYESLRVLGPAAVVSGAVHGLGGVGKTTLAVEYAYRYGSDYDVVWCIAAEQPATVAAQLVQLGQRLGLPETTNERDAVAGLLAELGGRDRWLLIYDNAEHPASLVGLIPVSGGGHVLVTSRWPDWRSHARTVQVPVWPRAESVAFLHTRTRHTDDRLLGELAELVGDLPLAVEEAAAYLEQTGEDLAAYVALVRGRARDLFASPGTAADVDRRRVASVWTLSLDRVHEQEPVAEQLLTLFAFLAPQVPRDLLASGPGLLPEELGAAVADRLIYNRLLEAVGRYALVTLNPARVGMHRLVQAVVQSRLDPGEEARWVHIAVSLVRGVFPDDGWEPARWPECEALVAHVLAVAEHAERAGVCGEEAGWLLERASTYLRERGRYRQAEPLARRALLLTEITFGVNHVCTASRHDEFGRVLQALGRLDEARTEFEQALTVSLAVLGADHPDISVWRSNLGVVLHDLGRLDDARAEFEQALAISLAILSPDHPDIGIRRSNLGGVLRALGRLKDARAEFEQALTIGLAAFGPDHHTIGIRRNNLAGVLRKLGRLDEARDQYEQALTISVAALGPDHPDIGIRRSNLGGLLEALGQPAEARAHYEQALAIRAAALGPDHQLVKTTLRKIEELRAASGE